MNNPDLLLFIGLCFIIILLIKYSEKESFVSETPQQAVARGINLDNSGYEYPTQPQSFPNLKDSSKTVKSQGSTIVHNHYYGGNKELAKFIKHLENEERIKLQEKEGDLIKSGQCGELNNLLSNTQLAEYRNERDKQDLLAKCNSREQLYKDDSIFNPKTDQTALIGTLLMDAQNTQFGSLIPDHDLSFYHENLDNVKSVVAN